MLWLAKYMDFFGDFPKVSMVFISRFFIFFLKLRVANSHSTGNILQFFMPTSVNFLNNLTLWVKGRYRKSYRAELHKFSSAAHLEKK
jgi:hypothetical protein